MYFQRRSPAPSGTPVDLIDKTTDMYITYMYITYVYNIHVCG